LKVWKSVWFPLGFTLLYVKLAFVIASSKDLNTSLIPAGALLAMVLAIPSILLLWTFYVLSFRLRLRTWRGVLLMTGLLSPVLITATIWLFVTAPRLLS
jgi:hypothetical protein